MQKCQFAPRSWPSGLVCLLALAASVSSGPASAAPRSYAGVFVGNSHYQGPPFNSQVLMLTDLASSDVAGTSVAEIDGFSRSFTGLDGAGQAGTEVLTASAKAQADYASLRVQSSYTLTNRLVNGANIPFVNANGSTNEAGVPTGFQAYAEARVSDKVTVSATVPVAYLQFTYRLTGTVTDSGGPVNALAGPDNYVSVDDRGGYGVFQSTASGSFDEYILPSAVPVIGGIASYDVMLIATAGLYTVFQPGPNPVGLSSSGSVDFFDTLQLVNVRAYSSDGLEVVMSSATGAGGFDYLLAAIPEPSTWALMLIGFGLLAWRARTRGFCSAS